MSARVGVSTCYYAFGAVAAVGAAFSALVVPETKGRSLEQIEASLTPSSA